MNETRDLSDHDLMIEPVTAGGGTDEVRRSDVTGPDAAAHVSDSHDGAVADASGHHAVHDEHEDQPLGPIDWPAWRASLLGIAVGVLICLALYLAIS